MTMLPSFKKIIYATDLGKNTRPVFRAALSVAQAYDAEIIMVHVVEPMSSAVKAVVDTYLSKVDAKKIYQDEMKAVLESMKERLVSFCEDELGTHDMETLPVTEMHVLTGRKSEEILKIAESLQADLIVLGKSTRNVMGSDVAGSAARRVSRHSTIPVMIIPNY